MSEMNDCLTIRDFRREFDRMIDDGWSPDTPVIIWSGDGQFFPAADLVPDTFHSDGIKTLEIHTDMNDEVQRHDA